VPVYLFSFHAYLSWLPDRREGYVRRDEGILDRDLDMADMYARNAKHDGVALDTADGVALDTALQRVLIEEALTACEKQSLHLHGAATDPSHVHLLVSWRLEKDSLKVRAGLKSSLSRRLNRHRRAASSGGDVGPSLSRAGSRKPVSARDHFDHLMGVYLPDHPGLQWYEDRGWVAKPK
jgi:REP element-mobilizing transposase RayT